MASSIRARRTSKSPLPPPPPPIEEPTVRKPPQGKVGAASSSSSSNHVQVVCRFRPMVKSEEAGAKGEPLQWFEVKEEDKTVLIRNIGKDLDFSFDKVFGTNSTQADVYASVGHVVDGVIDGFNGSLMAYGQTSSGKTHTMQGYGEAGIMPRALDRIFQALAAQQQAREEGIGEDLESTVKLSYVEIYCEKIQDLLNLKKENLKIYENAVEGVAIQEVTTVPVANMADVEAVLREGQKNRATSATKMNAGSSRSHAMLQVLVTQVNRNTQTTRRAKLMLVDLAGSERVGKTGVKGGARLEEAKNINRSLTTLGIVIKALADGLAYVPFRDSKLTRVIQEALGGNSRTALVICCAPELRHAPETVSTLRFGERARKISTHVQKNETLGIKELRILLASAEAEIAKLKAIIAKGVDTQAVYRGLIEAGHSIGDDEEDEDADEEEEEEDDDTIGGDAHEAALKAAIIKEEGQMREELKKSMTQTLARMGKSVVFFEPDAEDEEEPDDEKLLEWSMGGLASPSSINPFSPISGLPHEASTPDRHSQQHSLSHPLPVARSRKQRREEDEREINALREALAKKESVLQAMAGHQEGEVAALKTADQVKSQMIQELQAALAQTHEGSKGSVDKEVAQLRDQLEAEREARQQMLFRMQDIHADSKKAIDDIQLEHKKVLQEKEHLLKECTSKLAVSEAEIVRRLKEVEDGYKQAINIMEAEHQKAIAERDLSIKEYAKKLSESQAEIYSLRAAMDGAQDEWTKAMTKYVAEVTQLRLDFDFADDSLSLTSSKMMSRNATARAGAWGTVTSDPASQEAAKTVKTIAAKHAEAAATHRTLHEELEECEERVKQYETAMDETSKAGQQPSADAETLLQSIRSGKSEVERLRSLLAESQANIDKLKAEEVARAQELAVKIMNADAQFKAKEKALQDAKKRVMEGTGAQDAKEVVAGMADTLARKQAELDFLSHELKESEQCYANLYEQLRHTVQYSFQDKVAKQREIEELRASLRRFKNQQAAEEARERQWSATAGAGSGGVLSPRPFLDQGKAAPTPQQVQKAEADAQRIKELEEQVQTAEAGAQRIKELEEQVQKAEASAQRIKELEEQVQTAEACVQKAKELEEGNRKRASAEAEAGAQKIKELEEQVQKAEAGAQKIKELEEQVQKAEARVQNAKELEEESRKRASEEAASLRQSLAQVQAEVKAKGEELARATSQATELRAQLDKARAAVKVGEEENNRLQQELAEKERVLFDGSSASKKKHREKDVEVTRLADEVERLDGEVTTLKAALTQKEEARALLAFELEQIHGLIDGPVTGAGQAQGAGSEAGGTSAGGSEGTLKQQYEQVNTLRGEKERLLGEVRKIKGELVRLVTTNSGILNARKQHLVDVEVECQKLKAQVDRLQQELDLKDAQLKKQSTAAGEEGVVIDTGSL